MIKPNTLCMIKNLKPDQMGYDCNGKIVITQQSATYLGATFWDISPELYSKDGIMRAANEQYLYPLDNPSDDMIDTHSQIKETI